MKEKASIHYIMAHEKIRNLIFEEWEKTNLLLSQGPETLKQYFCKLWNETKMELEYTDEIDIIDLEKEIKPEDFNISYCILDNEIKAFNFIMPKPVTENEQVLYITLVITKGIPRLFTLELSSKKENDYNIGEWKINFENNAYIHINHNKIEESNIGEFLGKVNDVLNAD